MFKIRVFSDNGTRDIGVIGEMRDRDTGELITTICRFDLPPVNPAKLFASYDEAKKEADEWLARRYMQCYTFIVDNVA